MATATENTQSKTQADNGSDSSTQMTIPIDVRAKNSDLPKLVRSTGLIKSSKGRKTMKGAKEFLQGMLPYQGNPDIPYDRLIINSIKEYRSWYQRARNIDIRLGIGRDEKTGQLFLYKKNS